MAQRIDFTATGSVEIPTGRDVADIGSLQFVSGGSTVVVEGSLDGSNYVAIGLSKSVDNAVVASASAAGLWFFNCAAYEKVRVRCSAFVDATVVWAGTSRS